MLRRPIPAFHGRLSSLVKWGRSATREAATAAAKLRFGPLVVSLDRLEDRLWQVSRSAAAPGLLIGALLAANADEHGLGRVDDCADRAARRLDDPGARQRLLRALATLHERRGGILRPLTLYESLGPLRSSPAAQRRRALARQAELLRDGLELGPPVSRKWRPAPRRVLYYANQTLPHHASGYAIRTQGLARGLRERGWDLSVHARLGYPNDRYDFLGVHLVPRHHERDGVVYRFTPGLHRGRSIEAYQAASVEMLLRRCDELRPAVLHAASNYTGGLAVAEVGRRLSVPTIYEVRGLWHMTRAAAQPAYLDSDHYRLLERLEVQAAQEADHVFAITQGVRRVLTEGGVDPLKITVLPNAVDPELFHWRPRSRRLSRKWRLGRLPTVGYLGVFKDYEGLDLLLDAAAQLRRRRGDNFRVLLVGGGESEDALRRRVRRLGLQELVRFTGRVPHEQVPDYYGLCDVVAFPRRGLPLCEVVSPIKPFEALAAQKAVVASDVGALSEILRHGETGLLHRADDAESLAEQLQRLLEDPALRERLGVQGRQWVQGHRTWARVCQHVDDVYRDLLGSATG